MKKAILYSSNNCPYCSMIKNELTRWEVEFEERNVSVNPDFFDELHNEGIFSVPVVIIDEEKFIGYRPNKMKKYLGIDE